MRLQIPGEGSHAQKMFALKGRVALVTGASGYLGRCISSILCSAGARVILNGRDPKKLALLAGELNSNGGQAETACFDITDKQKLKRAIRGIGQRYGRLDILVNNAYDPAPGSIENATPANFAKAYAVCVTAAFETLQTSLPLLKRSAKMTKGGASVINIASMYGTVSPDPSLYGTSGQNNPPFYGPAKAGLMQWTRYAACHLACHHIRVNSLSPGAFPKNEVLRKNPGFHKKIRAKIPLGRVGVPDEVAGPLLFLASDASSYVTGVNLPVDGGWTAW